MPSNAKSQARVPCDQCNKTFRGTFELNRHRVQHSPDKSRLMYRCDWPGCKHGTLQKSNLRTHVENTHLKLHRHKCTIDPINCKRAFSDASSLTRHKRKVHGHFRRESTLNTASSPSPSDSESSSDSGSERSVTPSLTPAPDYSTMLFEPMDVMTGVNGDYLAGLPMPEFMQGSSCLPIIPDASMGHQLFYPDTSSCQPFVPDMSLYRDTAFSTMPLEYLTTESRDNWVSLCPEPTLPPSYFSVAADTAFSGIHSEFEQFMNMFGIPQL